MNDVARTYSHVASLRVEALGGDDEVWLKGLTMNATVDGGDGNDCIDASAVTQLGVVLYGGAGNDRLTGGAGNDRMDGGTGDDELNGGCGNDVLVGGQGKDCLNGGDGNDLLDGGGDNDQLRGGKGNDLLVADSGDDYLKGEDGNDILVGGAGNDTIRRELWRRSDWWTGPAATRTAGLYSQDRLVDGSQIRYPHRTAPCSRRARSSTGRVDTLPWWARCNSSATIPATRSGGRTSSTTSERRTRTATRTAGFAWSVRRKVCRDARTSPVRDLGKLRAMHTTASRHSHASLRAQANPES